MPAPTRLTSLLGEVRSLTDAFKAGGAPAFDPFRDLVSLLLSSTVLEPSGGIRLFSGPAGPGRVYVGGWRHPLDPLPLRDGRYLQLAMTLFVDGHTGRVKVEKAKMQYQLDADVSLDRWIVRYDYIRDPADRHPPAHMQIRGTLLEDCLPAGVPLKDIHFPTGRVSIEAMIRLLAEEFGVPCKEEPGVWRQLLSASERAFLDIAHRPLSGPAGSPDEE